MSIDKGRKFIVITTPRSGSAWLISILNQIDEITAYGGLFIQRKRAEGKEEWDSNYAYPRFIERQQNGLGIRPFSVFSYLNTLYDKPGLVGFKVMYFQLSKYPELLAYMIFHQIPVVHLVRQNHLDVFISRTVMRKTQKPHPLSDQREFHEIQVELDPRELVKRLKGRQRMINMIRHLLRWLQLPHIEVSYEDLVHDPSSFNRIWDFLSVDPGEKVPQSKLVKIQKRGHADVISNYSEVKEVLASTRFAHLIK